jgi:hypothetical protein
MIPATFHEGISFGKVNNIREKLVVKERIPHRVKSDHRRGQHKIKAGSALNCRFGPHYL